MTIEVAIPSVGRERRLVRATLPLLLTGGIAPEQITVFTSDELAALDYQAVLPPGVKIAHGHGLGMRAARNHIARHYPVGTRLVEVDDDLTAFYRFAGKHTMLRELQPGELAATWQNHFGMTSTLWCWYPVANQFFMSDKVRRGSLWYAVGALFGYTVQGDDAELVYVDDKEDFERSIRFYLRDGEVVRFDGYSFATRYYSEPGGMQVYRSKQTIDRGAATLAASYPEHARFYRRKDGRAEIRLRP